VHNLGKKRDRLVAGVGCSCLVGVQEKRSGRAWVGADRRPAAGDGGRESQRDESRLCDLLRVTAREVFLGWGLSVCA
jgi:hypothetical protein